MPVYLHIRDAKNSTGHQMIFTGAFDRWCRTSSIGTLTVVPVVVAIVIVCANGM